MGLCAKAQTVNTAMGKHVKKTQNGATSRFVIVACSTACFFVVYLIDTAIIQPPTPDGRIWSWCQHYALELAALGCCILALAAPRLLSAAGLLTKTKVPKKSIAPPCHAEVPHAHRKIDHVNQLTKWVLSIDAASKAADPDLAEQLFVEMQQHGVQPNTTVFNSVLHACARKGEMDRAENWLRQMKADGVERNVVTYNIMMDTCSKVKDAESTEAFFLRMYEDGIAANVVSFATVIHARAKRGDARKAEAWLRKMKDFNVEPNVVIYNSLINASGRKGHVDIAEKWFEEMMAVGIEPMVSTFTAVVDACAKARDLEGAEKWMRKMTDAGVEPNSVSYSTIIDACAKACDPARAEHWHREMVNSGAEPHPHSYGSVINAYAKIGDVVAAERWLVEMENVGIGIDVVAYSSVLAACAKANDTERAMNVFRQMQQKGVRPNIVTYSSLARPFANKGDWQQVELIYDEMTAAGIEMNDYFLYAMINAYGSSTPKECGRAESRIREAVDSGIKINDQIVAGLLRCLGRPGADFLLRQLGYENALRLAGEADRRQQNSNGAGYQRQGHAREESSKKHGVQRPPGVFQKPMGERSAAACMPTQAVGMSDHRSNSPPSPPWRRVVNPVPGEEWTE